MNFKKCSTSTRNKIISVKEEKNTFRINNKNKIIITEVIVDGCLINDHRERCDYLFEINDPFTSVVYVELKGTDIMKAFKQLGATIGYCKKRHNGFKDILTECDIKTVFKFENQRLRDYQSITERWKISEWLKLPELRKKH